MDAQAVKEKIALKRKKRYFKFLLKSRPEKGFILFLNLYLFETGTILSYESFIRQTYT